MTRVYAVDYGNTLRLNNRKFIIKNIEGNSISIPSNMVDGMIVAITAQVTPKVIKFCLRNNITRSCITSRGYW